MDPQFFYKAQFACQYASRFKDIHNPLISLLVMLNFTTLPPLYGLVGAGHSVENYRQVDDLHIPNHLEAKKNNLPADEPLHA
jgi:hypothetical protein